MTTATKLRREGINEGIQKGKIENQKELIIRFYVEKGFFIKEISELLKVDKSFVENTLREQKLIE